MDKQNGSNGFVAVIVYPTEVTGSSEDGVPIVWQTRIVPVMGREQVLFGGFLRFVLRGDRCEKSLLFCLRSDWSVEESVELFSGDEVSHLLVGDDMYDPTGYNFKLKFCSSLKEAKDWLAERIAWSAMVRAEGLR